MAIPLSYRLTTWITLLGFFLGFESVASGKPVKVFILSGQSNMVGAGKVDGGSSRWGNQFIDPVVSVYKGDYDPEVDYDSMEPTKTLKLEAFGGVRPTPYPGGGVQVTRGFVRVNGDGHIRVQTRLWGVDLQRHGSRRQGGSPTGSRTGSRPHGNQTGRRQEGALQNHLLHQAGQWLGLDRPSGRARGSLGHGQVQGNVSIPD